MERDLGGRLEAALGELLQRRIRNGLYADLVEEIGRGLDMASYPVLTGVARYGPVTAGRLAGEIGLDRSGVSRHANRLEEGGLLQRRPDVADGRGTLLVLTDDGEQAVAHVRRRLAELFVRRLDAWPPDEAHAFVTGMERFVREQRSAASRPKGSDPKGSDPTVSDPGPAEWG